MRLDRFSSLVNRLKTLLVCVTCAVLVFATAAPALAFGGNGSSAPTEGEAQLNQVQAESEEAVDGNPRSMDEVQSKARPGLNGVQGTANAEKMERPSNSQSAQSVRKEAADTIDSATSD